MKILIKIGEEGAEEKEFTTALQAKEYIDQVVAEGETVNVPVKDEEAGEIPTGAERKGDE